MRAAIIGNVASNAYLLAKFQQRVGIEAHSFDLGGGNLCWTPWWEDAYFDHQQYSGWSQFYHLSAITTDNGFRRPPWAKILGRDGVHPWYDTQEDFEADLPRLLARLFTAYRVSDADLPALHRDMAHGRLTHAEQVAHEEHARAMPFRESILAIARAYDLTVLCGPAAQYAAYFPLDCPVVTFEHATMRPIPLLANPADRFLASAYQHADWNVITNADCHEAAQCLGLSRASFIPHPLDEEKFSPAPPAGTTHRDALRKLTGADLLFYAPARHSSSESSGAKRNDRLLYAYRRYLDQVEGPANAGGNSALPRSALILASWGEHLERSLHLAQHLGLMTGDPANDRIVWTDFLPKLKARDVYRACDVVFDQFSPTVGSFGTVTAEGLACGLPVVTWADPKVHEWCADVLPLPPVCNALTVTDIYDWMVLLAGSKTLRQAIGRESRQWVERYHGWRTVTGHWIDLYERLLARRDDLDEARRRLREDPPAPAVAPAESMVPVAAGPGHAGVVTRRDETTGKEEA